MSEEINDYEEDKESAENHIDSNESTETITRVTGMYKEWFLDYASYVILERAVPGINDGFKPVQRRIMHSMKDLDDGRYNKVANIVKLAKSETVEGLIDQIIEDRFTEMNEGV